MKKKLSGIAIALLILLGIRAVVQVLAFIVTLGAGQMLGALLLAVLAAAYIMAFMWVLRGDKRGLILALIIAVVDAIAAIFMAEGAGALGAIIYDIILAGLAYKLWKDAGGKNMVVDAKKIVKK
jgi:hypothetical protein